MPAYNVAAVIRDTLTSIFTIPERVLTKAICEVLININTQNVNEIHLVHISDPILSLIRDIFIEINESKRPNGLLNVIELGEEMVSTAIEKRLKGKPDELLIHNKVKVFIYCADIAKLNVDAIVCPNDEKLSCSSGLSKELADRAGTVYKKRCRKAAKGKTLMASDVVSINTKKHGVIINVVVPHLRTSLVKDRHAEKYNYGDSLRMSFQNAIAEARKGDIRVLAMHPLGAGKSG